MFVVSQPVRTLALVAVENLHGMPVGADAEEMARVVEDLRFSACLQPTDHVVLGCNPRAAFIVAPAWPGARLVCRHGKDGADLALLACADDLDFVARRYDRVVVASGDGIFANLAAALIARGVAVEVYARPSATSLRLRVLGVTHDLPEVTWDLVA